MIENQQVEWKQVWRDEFLKWICGFANAQGGVLEIGRDNDGNPVGVSNATELMESLPGKMRDALGIIADIDLVEEDGHELVRITVDPYPSPISYKGEYHYRSGSTKQLLKGAALDRFLLGKTGIRWDSVPLPGVSVGDLDATALKRFRQLASGSKRLRAADLDIEDLGLLQKLRLTEGKYLKRSAVLLFHPDPEQFITGASVKIGFFEGAEVLFHDEVQGNLFTQMDRTMDLLLTKYLRAMIDYEGIYRVERFPVPRAALREMVLNAIVHKDYGSAVPIQIRVHGDRLSIWNNGRLPEGWTVSHLIGKHPSQPSNPDIANTFFRAGIIESWGRGIERVIRACEEAGLTAPELTHEAIGLMVEFAFGEQPVEQHSDGAVEKGKPALRRHQAGTKPVPSRHQVTILEMCRENRTLSDLMNVTGRSDRTKFKRQVIEPLLEAGLLEMTRPERPQSPKQKYLTTPIGLATMRKGTKPAPRRHQAGTKPAPSQHQVTILEMCREDRTLSDLMRVSGRSDRTKFRRQAIEPLLEAGLLEMTRPEKPRSPKQKYLTTSAGLAILQEGTK